MAESDTEGMDSVDAALFGTWRGLAEHLRTLGAEETAAEYQRQIETWQRRAEKVEASAGRVKAIHVKVRRKPTASGKALRVLQTIAHDPLMAADEWCHHCRTEWPCATRAALDAPDPVTTPTPPLPRARNA